MEFVTGFVTGFVTEIFSKILAYSCAPIKRHIGYAVSFRSKFNKLENEVKKLKNLEHDVEEKRRQGDEIFNTVTDWQRRAGEAIRQAEEHIQRGKEEAQNSCSARLSLNLKKSYNIGKKAEEKTAGIIQLHEEGRGFVSISYCPPLQQIVKPPVEGYEAESRNKILKEVMDALLDSNVNMVGVYGMGGIGKTTLAKEVHRQAKRDKLFEYVILATVTETPELRRVQGEIADILELKFNEETEVGRASRLHQTLKVKKSALIILDDLWNMLELDKVGIPTGNDSEGCKVLLTSRRLDVLSDMGSLKNFPVQLLSTEEAKKLFEIQVSDVKNSKIEEEILLKCAGFPLLIVTVAGLLKNKDLPIWKDTLEQLSTIGDGEIEAKVNSVLESSYNNLHGEDSKLIFLLCAICGQSNTSILDLLKYSLGLGYLKCRTIEAARNRLYRLMDNLKSSSLLLGINEAGRVSMHDTVRDFALSKARRDQRVFRVIDAANPLRVWPSRDELENCKIISLPYSDIKELPEDLGCPNAEFLLFSSTGDAEFFLFSPAYHSLDISDSSFQGIKLLKVLCFSKVCFSPLPRSFCFLTSLHTLCLDRCQLRDMTIIGQLKKLEILSFCRSELESLPSEIGELSKLKLLDLSYCSKLRVIPANVISKLSSLEELLMRGSFNEWEIQEHSNSNNARLSELESLSHLSSLEIHVPNAKALPRNLFSKHLERFQILIGDWDGWRWDEDYKRSKTLKLKLNTDIDVLDRVKILLKETEALYLGNMSRTMNVLPKVEIGGFSKLRELAINSCNKLKNIFNLSMIRSLFQLEKMKVSQCHGVEGIVVDEGDREFDRNEGVEFSRLRILKLSSLPQLKGFIYKKKSSPVYEITAPGCSETTSSYELGTPLPLFDKMVVFPCLEVLKVSDIHNIGTVFSSGILGRFQKLKSLRVQSCDLLEEIYQFQDLNVERPNETLKFELKSLHLSSLPKLKNVWSSGRFFTFENLEEMQIYRCGALKNIFPPNISGRFQKLKSLRAWDCDFLEEIYQFQDLSVERPNETLKFELKSLDLMDLPKLKNVWMSSGRFFTFENLESIEVWRCEALKNIFPASIAKKFPQLKTLRVVSCGKLEEMVAREESVWNNIPSFSFPQLTSLHLSNLREIRSFYPGRHTLECPKLNDLTLRGFHKRSMLISESSSSGLHQTRGEGPHHDDIISHYQQLFFLPEKVISNLEHMSMDDISFKTILHSSLSIQYLTKLSSLILFDFRGKLMTISQFGVFESMPNLRQLEVRRSYLKELWRYRRVDGDQTNSVTSPLPYIKILKLSSVEGLKHVWRQDSQMNPLLQYLETLELRACKNLISLAPTSYASFQNLTSLEIRDCNQMINLMNLSIAKTMANLVEIQITSCSALKEIVAAEDGQDNSDKITNESIVFNKLKTLKLDGLENLIGFCMSSRYSFHLPCLEEVSMKRCPNMRIFCDGNLYTPKLGNINSRGLDRDLKATIKRSYEEMIGIQQINSVKLSRIPQLKERWHGQLPFKFFRSLHELVVDKCVLFSSAIPSNLLSFLNNLYNLVVEQCDSVEEVFDLDGLNAAEGHVGLLSQLHRLELIELPKLRHVWNEDPLRILGIRNLGELKVHRCGNLRNIFTLPMAVGLVNLWSLEVKECALVEVIIKKEGEEEVDWDHKTMFPSLKFIELEHLPSLVNFYSGGHVLRCPSLSNVNVVGCPKMFVYGCSNSSREEQVPSSTIVEIHEEGPSKGSVDDMTTLRFFNGQIEIASLKELVVEWNSAVNDIWHAIFPAPFLCTLEVIQLIGFPAELPLLPSGFLHSLPNLYKFVVSDSFSEIIFPKEVNTVKEIQPASPSAKLRILKLFNLPNLKHLVEDDSQLGSLFQHLEELEVIKCSGLIRLITSSMAKGLVKLRKMVVKECERMTEIFPKEGNTVKEIQPASSEDDSQLSSLFQCLRELEVIKCNGLIRLITASTAKGLVELQKMVVKGCERMTEIVASEANEVETDGGFDQLKYLELHDLPRLTSFSPNCTLNFPILQEVIVRECPMMMIFAQNCLRTPLLDEVQTGEDEDAWRWKGSLNNTIEKLFLEMNVQDV